MSGEYSQLWLTSEGARTNNLQHEDAEVELSGAELEALYERIERPSPAPPDLGRSEADVTVYLTCDGDPSIREFSAAAGRDKNAFELWRIDPTRIERLIAAARK